MNEEIIKEYIKDKLDKEVTIEKRLMGGMSNYTYLVEIDAKKYTFRIPGKGANNFTNRINEKEIMEIIKPYDFLPHPLINDVENGFKLAPYVEGVAVNQIDVKPYEAVAALLKKLHRINKFPNDYEHLKRLEKYENITNDKDPVYLALKEKWLEIYEHTLKHIELRPCHGDAQTANFILDEKRIYLLDWEFAANNDPIYDIACFGNNNMDEAKKLIEVYFEMPGKKEYQRLYAWRMFQSLQWHNVAKFKHENGLSKELAVNFEMVAKAYLDKAKSFFQDYLDVSKED